MARFIIRPGSWTWRILRQSARSVICALGRSARWSGAVGKAGCHCAKPEDGGHDPQVRLTRKR